MKRSTDTGTAIFNPIQAGCNVSFFWRSFVGLGIEPFTQAIALPEEKFAQGLAMHDAIRTKMAKTTAQFAPGGDRRDLKEVSQNNGQASAR